MLLSSMGMRNWLMCQIYQQNFLYESKVVSSKSGKKTGLHMKSTRNQFDFCKCKLYFHIVLDVFHHRTTNTCYMPGTLLCLVLCLGDAEMNKIISPCPQRSSGRDKIASKSDRIIDVYIKSCGNTKEKTISCLRGSEKAFQKRTCLSKILKDEQEFALQRRLRRTGRAAKKEETEECGISR